MIYIKSEKEINVMRQGGRILASVLDEIIKEVKVGVNIKDLDKLADDLIIKHGGKPSFKGYKNKKDDPAFPSVMCISINSEVVHGDGTRSIILQDGDIVDFDIGMQYPAKNGLYTDMSKTVPVGEISNEAEKLLRVTEKSLELGLKQIKPGNKLKDIQKAIQDYVEGNGFSVVRSLTGHGVGKEVHEEPMIPNYVEEKFGNIIIEKGMTLAIEPMVNVGNYEIKTLDDGWTVATSDNKLSAHFEHTIAVTENGCEILTKYDSR
ncbi:type I methionyl aminopeptidase [Candidatus Falkowbacteria bacterium]|jgi:methionyl aminopeptidase|nr:type I methionyl aminopeptidase [Candidatus Falkowbacteria bacterium]MBT4433015.1 type I methionyl aminopeptidase [Candidatus Falkowbacteria bacterium]